jgi:hypothetical protein
MIHKLILSKQDNQGNITYYTVNDYFDNSMIIDMIDDDDITEIPYYE